MNEGEGAGDKDDGSHKKGKEVCRGRRVKVHSTQWAHLTYLI